VEECLSVARVIVSSLPLSDQEKERLSGDVELGLAFHDAGKAAIGFQKMLRGEAPDWGHKRHEILSASLASSIPSVNEATIFAILTHHKSIPNSLLEEEKSRALDMNSIPLDKDSTGYLAWKRMKSEWYDNYESFRESWEKICKLIGRDDLAEVKSLPAIRLCNSWLKRGVGRGSQLKSESFADRRYFALLRGILMTSDHLASGGHFPSTWKTSINGTVNSKVDQEIGRKKIHEFQLRMAQTVGDVILKAPTGSGKTEAALMWAAKNEEPFSRLFYVLPNIASINAMFVRLRKFFGIDSVGLLHSRAREAIYRKLSSGEDIESKLNDEANAKMLAEVAHAIWFKIRVSTPHQILRYSLRGRGWETMLAEFPKSLFIFDEIHAYDPRIVGQIIATAKLVRGWDAKCAFISATMPSFLIKTVSENLSIDGLLSPSFVLPDDVLDKALLEKKRHKLQLEEGTLVNQIGHIIDDMERGMRVLVVCNTVSSSQWIFAEIRNALISNHAGPVDHEIIMLIHSRFTRRDRTNKETLIMNVSTRPKILVATQVIEVSLDISYDVAYLEPAPIDATVQRMGRVNRYGEKGDGAIIHILKEEISSRSVYSRNRIERSIDELSGLARKGLPLSEFDLVQAVEQVYKEGYDEKEQELFDQGIKNQELQNFECEMIAGASEDWKEQVLSESWGIDVLPNTYLDDYEFNYKKKLYVEAYGFLATVPCNTRIAQEADLTHDPPISFWDYSTSLGFTVPKDDPWDDDLLEKAPTDPSNII
jgi:CRISPR-associated endonuclease/helicase Cas3